MSTINLVQLGLALLLEGCLLALLLRRAVHKEFPLFFTFVALSLPATVGRLLTVNNYQAYFVVFWASNAGLLLLGLSALHEVFRSVYAGFYEFRWFRLLYYGAIALVLLITVKNSVEHPPIQSHPLVSLVLSIGITINLLQAGIAALFAVFAKPFAVEHRRYPFGIVAGFAISALGPFVGYLARSVFGKNLDTFTQNISPVAYICALVIWCLTFFKPETERSKSIPPMSPDEMLRVMREYLRALGKQKAG